MSKLNGMMRKNVTAVIIILMTGFGALSFWIKSTLPDEEKISSKIISSRSYVLNDSQLKTGFKTIDQGKSVSDEIISHKESETWSEVLFHLSNEIFVLGLLVFVWEYLHHLNLQNKISKNQKEALLALAYFFEIRSTDSNKQIPQSKFKKFIASIGSYFKKKGNAETKKELRLIENNFKEYQPPYKKKLNSTNFLTETSGKENYLTFSPVKGERLFYNLGTVLSGYQDLMIDSTERDPDEHKIYIEIYENLRTIEFLNDRFGFFNEMEINEDFPISKLVKVQSALILEIIYHLVELNIQINEIVNPGLEPANEKEQNIKNSVQIQNDIIARLWHSVSKDSFKKPIKSIDVNFDEVLGKEANEIEQFRKKLKEKIENSESKQKNEHIVALFEKYYKLNKKPSSIIDMDWEKQTLPKAS